MDDVLQDTSIKELFNENNTYSYILEVDVTIDATIINNIDQPKIHRCSANKIILQTHNTIVAKGSSIIDAFLVILKASKDDNSNNTNLGIATLGAQHDLVGDGQAHTYTTVPQDPILPDLLPPAEQFESVKANGGLPKNTPSSLGDKSNITLLNNVHNMHHNLQLHVSNINSNVEQDLSINESSFTAQACGVTVLEIRVAGIDVSLTTDKNSQGTMSIEAATSGKDAHG